MKIKVGIYGGEAFPVYSVHSDGFTEIEVDEDILKRWKVIFAAFSLAQDEIICELRKQGKGHKVWSGDFWEGFSNGIL